MAADNIIYNNAYGILGLLPNASQKELSRRLKEIEKFISIEEPPSYAYDYNVYDKERTSQTVHNAFLSISNVNSRLLHYFFRIYANSERQIEILNNIEKEFTYKNIVNIYENTYQNTFIFDKNIAITLSILIMHENLVNIEEAAELCINIWHFIVYNEKYIKDFQKMFLLDDEIGIDETILDNIEERLITELTKVFSDISQKYGNNQILAMFIDKFELNNSIFNIDTIEEIYSDIQRNIEIMDSMNISADGIFDNQEKALLKKCLNAFRDNFNKLIDLGLYDNEKTVIIRDLVATKIRIQILDLFNNLAESSTAYKLIQFAIYICGTNGLKEKLQTDMSVIRETAQFGKLDYHPKDSREYEDKAKEILNSIFSKIELCENEIDKMTAYKADMLIRNLKSCLDNLNSNVLNPCIIIDLQAISKMLVSANKTIEALKLLNYAYSIAATNGLKKSIKNDIDEINNNNNKYNKTNDELPFIKIRYDEKSDINWKLSIIISIVIIFSCFIGIATYQNNKKGNAISQIKNTAYEYLKNGNEYEYSNELKKLSRFDIDINNAKTELLGKYNKEKQQIIADIAYNYENNREMFNSLKQQYLQTLFNGDENKFNEAVEQKLGYKELSLKLVPLPQSGLMHNYTGKEAIAPFEIQTRVSENYYIKLVNIHTGKTEVAIFMRGGETKKMHVPLGTYKIKYASGINWYGENYLFGHKTQYTASDKLLTFKIPGSYVEGHTLTLYKVVDGNFSTYKIKADDF